MFEAKLDLTQFHRKVEQSRRAIEKDIERAVKKAAFAGRDRAREGEWQDKSGELRRTIQVSAFSWDGNIFWGEWRTQVPYALFVEEPTKPHEIWPKAGYNARSTMPGQTRRGRGKGPHEHVVGRGYALRWKDGSGGEIFARHVYHPGTAGFHFMARSQKAAVNTLIQDLHGGFVNLHSVWAA